MSLLTQRLKSRESTVEAGGYSFTVRRPTDEEVVDARANKSTMIEMVKKFVVGWDVTELDVVPGGCGDKVPFDADLFADWIADQPELWVTLGESILAAYEAHTKRREDALKN